MNFDRAAACVLGREAMRELDARTIAAGTPSIELMERAGRALADALADQDWHGVRLPPAPRLLVVAGRGNNGGDGFVVARLLTARGWACTVALVGGEPAEGDAAANLARWRDAGGIVAATPGSGELEEVMAGGAFDLGLDAVFGTGLAREVTGPVADIIRLLNVSGLPIVSADIPSGLCADSGTPLGVATACRATVSIGAGKPGLFLAEGPAFAGRVRVADIGLLPPADAGLPAMAGLLGEETTAGTWPRLAGMAHKGSRGHVLVVAGARGKSGAAVLAARAALRAGAGLVTVACTAAVQDAVAASLPEAMTLLLPEDADGAVAASAVARLKAAAADCVVAGPGLGTAAGADAVVAWCVGQPASLLLDADALNIVAAWEATVREGRFGARRDSGAAAAILTPHPGEMARLAATDTASVQRARAELATGLAAELGSVVVLKGAATVVASAAQHAFNLSGNPGMGAAGMGDVLSGICGAVAARGLESFDAAALAVHVHGAAGDLLERGIGSGFLAGEVADEVPALLAARRPR